MPFSASIRGPAGPTGPAGATGAAGAQGAQGPIGPAGQSFVFRGAWSGATAYVVGDVVNQGAGAWICILNSTNHTPTSDAGVHWVAFEIGGPEGAQGATGATGATGAAGAAGAAGATGPTGPDGRTILNLTVPPTTEGANGDFAIDVNTWTLYGPKASGAWPAGVALIVPEKATADFGAGQTTLTTATSTSVVQANADRAEVTIVNDSDAIVYLALGATAFPNRGVRLNANGGAYTTTAYTGQVTAYQASGAAKSLTYVDI